MKGLAARISAGELISRAEASAIASVQGGVLFHLFAAANDIREKLRQGKAELCAIINAKSGGCSEDCSYCSQSVKSRAGIPAYPLIGEDAVIEKALEAKEAGVKRFCIVTSGRKAGKRELGRIASMIGRIRDTGLLPCATLGLLKKDELAMLKESGLERYHHNLETSREFFPSLCSTHTYADKLKTIEAALATGLSVCSGGIFGTGESWHDRIEMAFVLRDLGIDSVPLNFLIPVEGTPLGKREPLHPFEALQIISLYRFILPDKQIRVCGGRRQVLGEFNSMVFMAGADCLLTGNYLTTTGTPYDEDLGLLRQYGLQPE
ncbi:MAG: biotin synthase BioB [Nitrospirae bacterium]|nr:biotin synthase BioB [Nitrospirota bacterium]